MLEHLDGHDQVVVLNNVESALVVGDVASNNSNVVDIVSSGLSGGQDVFALRAAVGNSGDLGVGVLSFVSKANEKAVQCEGEIVFWS